MSAEALKEDLRRSIVAYRNLMDRYAAAFNLVEKWYDRAGVDPHGYPYEEGYRDAMDQAATELLKALRGGDGDG